MNKGRKTRRDDKQTTDNLGEAFERNIRPFIEVIDNLRSHGLHNDIKLPNVVVVGDQSSGKSSIIESLSGVQLPRGKGIVTRCPLELQLKRMVNNVKWHAILSHSGIEYQIERPEDVGDLISRVQDEICGATKDVSDKLITLRIESNSKTAPELTLIDLPGIARMALDGQSQDICFRIKDIIESFVQNENTVILCMISANLDLAVNESLGIARKFDPESERTIGVITKPDLADKNQKEEMIRLLGNQRLTLKKGYSIVKCRNQEQIGQNLSLDDMLTEEQEFFKNDPYYMSVDPRILGTKNLADKITEELVAVIQKTIPVLKSQVESQMVNIKEQLRGLPNKVPEKETDKRAYLTTIFFDMVKDFEKLLLKGSYSIEMNKDVNIFPRWRNKFRLFQESLTRMQNQSLAKECSSNKLIERIEAARGRDIAFFLNYELFEKVISDHVAGYLPLAKQLLCDIRSITEDAVKIVIDRTLEHLPSVKQDIKTLVSKDIGKFSIKAEESLDLIFDNEKIVFTMDNLFQEQIIRVFSNNKERNSLSLDDNAIMLNGILRSYFNIVLNRLCDIIPMTIRQWIHFRLNTHLKEFLMSYASDGSNEEKVQEDAVFKERRRILTEKLRRLHIAKSQLNGF